MELTWNLLAVVLLLAANAFFVAAEFALVKARGFRIAALADQGGASARLTVRIQKNLEAYLAACQLGITMASLGLGWVGEPTVAAMLGPVLGWDDATVERELEHYLARVEAEVESQTMPDDHTADAARMGAPDIRTMGSE